MKKIMTFAAGSLLLLSSCSSYTTSGALIGGSLGSAIGGIAGGWRGHDIGLLVGTAVGAAAGAAAEEAEYDRSVRRARAYQTDDDVYYTESRRHSNRTETPEEAARRERIRTYHANLAAKRHIGTASNRGFHLEHVDRVPGSSYQGGTASYNSSSQGYAAVAQDSLSQYSKNGGYDDRVYLDSMSVNK